MSASELRAPNTPEPASPDVQLAGRVDLDRILQRAERKLLAHLDTSAKAGKPPIETSREVQVGARWGWTRWKVDQYGHRDLLELAVVRPGTDRNHRTLLAANSDNGIVYQVAGAGVGSIAGLAGGWAIGGGVMPLLLAAGGAAAGMGAGILQRRRLNRWQRDSVRLTGDQIRLTPTARAVQIMNQIDWHIAYFNDHMAEVSTVHGTEPVPLPLAESPTYVLAEVHQAVWDLASDQTSNSPDDVLTELRRIATAIDEAVTSAWTTWHAARVEIPPDPALRRPTVDRLSRLTGSVTEAHTASREAAHDVDRINHRG